MKSLWSKFLAAIHSSTTSLKKEEMRLMGEMVLRIEAIEHHLTDGENDDDAVNPYRPNLDKHVDQVNSALSDVKADNAA
jgi:hypothetical protein